MFKELVSAAAIIVMASAAMAPAAIAACGAKQEVTSFYKWQRSERWVDLIFERQKRNLSPFPHSE